MRAAILILASATLAACASAEPDARAASRFAALSQECSQRGGAVVPVFDPASSRGGYTCSGASGLGGWQPPLREAR